MSVKRNLLANYAGAAWSGLMGLAFLPLYVQYLGIEAYGLIGFFASLQVWFALLDMGLSPTLNREMARFTAGQHTAQGIRDLLRSMEFIYGGIALLLAVAFVAASSWLATRWLNAQQLPRETVMQAFMLMGLCTGLRWMTVLYRSAVIGLQQQVWLNGLVFVTATLRGLGVVAVLAFIAPTLQAFFVFQALIGLLELVALQGKVYRLLPPAAARFSLPTLQRVWRFAAGVTLISFLATLLTQVDKVILSKLLPLEDFGYFMLATTVGGAIYLLVAPMSNAIYPRFSELVARNDEATLARDYHRMAQLLAVMLLPPALLLAGFAHDILRVWTGSTVTADHVAGILALWAVGTALNGLNHVPAMAQLAYGWSTLGVVLNGVAVMVVIPAFLVLVPQYGGLAAAWIWIALNVGYLTIGIAAMHARILKQEMWRWYFQDNLLPLLAGLFATAGMLLVARLLPGLGRIAEALFLALALLAIYAATACATPLGRQLLRDARVHLSRHVPSRMNVND